MSSVSTEKMHMFTVTAGNDIQEVESREAAVTLAKGLSNDRGNRVTVERDDGMVLMQFSNGGLDSYVYETRDRRSRARVRDPQD